MVVTALCSELAGAQTQVPDPTLEPSSSAAGSGATTNSTTAPESEPSVQVTVQGTSRAEQLRESAQTVKVVETDVARLHSADMGEVLARTEGVAIQRSGGLGAQSRLSIHGLTDDQIRVFVDGVPLTFSGFGLGIATVPVSWAKRVEIYRGAVPVRLGTDALGGAIDVVTSDELHDTTASISYGGGSFDTHQLALNLQKFYAPTGFVVRTSGNYERSRNDYPITANVANSEGQLVKARTHRFHDRYVAATSSLEFGVIDQPWARKLLLRLFGTRFAKDLQHNVDMSVPYGQVRYGETTTGGTLRCEQPSVARGPLGVFITAGASHRAIDFVDTSPFIHDWFGRQVYERREGSGEIGLFASDLTQWEISALARLMAQYQIAPGHVARLVIAPDVTTRTGRERLRINPDRIDPLTTRRRMTHAVSALEYAARDLDDQIDNSLFVKHYWYGLSADQVRTFDNAVHQVDDVTKRFGAGDALRVRLNDELLAKASFEYATRLPRSDEVFGDGVLTLPNLELAPESSHNANLGLSYLGQFEHIGGVAIEPSAFLRDSDEMVIRMMAQDRVHLIYQNVYAARSVGIDAMLRWTSPQRWLTLQVNGTWQEQRNQSDKGAFAAFAGQRIPNRPWMFANASAELDIPNAGLPNANLTLAWISRYVHEFFPGWGNLSTANGPGYVPSQLFHSIGFGYIVKGPFTVTCALDLFNVTDAETFDVLGVQKPGRAAYFKLTLDWEQPP